MVPVCRGSDGSRQALGFRYTDKQKGELDEPDLPRANRTTSIETVCCSSTRQEEKTAEQDLTKVLARQVPGLIRTKRPSARRTSPTDKRNDVAGTTDRQDECRWDGLGSRRGRPRVSRSGAHGVRGRLRWARPAAVDALPCTRTIRDSRSNRTVAERGRAFCAAKNSL